LVRTIKSIFTNEKICNYKNVTNDLFSQSFILYNNIFYLYLTGNKFILDRDMLCCMDNYNVFSLLKLMHFNIKFALVVNQSMILFFLLLTLQPQIKNNKSTKLQSLFQIK
jgi:hypothetical protein